jgi:hypothetical protein
MRASKVPRASSRFGQHASSGQQVLRSFINAPIPASICASTLNAKVIRTMRTIGFVFFLAFSVSAYGQADCVIRFTYTWTTDFIKDEDIEVGLPTTKFLGDYSTNGEDRSFVFVKLSNQEATLTSHMSSEFCREHQKTIDTFFKGKKNFYLLTLRTNKEDKRQIEVPIDSITFSFDKIRRQIIIELPKIRQ